MLGAHFAKANACNPVVGFKNFGRRKKMAPATVSQFDGTWSPSAVGFPSHWLNVNDFLCSLSSHVITTWKYRQTANTNTVKFVPRQLYWDPWDPTICNHFMVFSDCVFSYVTASTHDVRTFRNVKDGWCCASQTLGVNFEGPLQWPWGHLCRLTSCSWNETCHCTYQGAVYHRQVFWDPNVHVQRTLFHFFLRFRLRLVNLETRIIQTS